MRDRDRLAGPVLLEEARQTIVADQAKLLLVDLLDQLARIAIAFTDRADDLAYPPALLHQAGRKTEHLEEAPVADDEALVPVDHAQCLGHVVERRFEQLVVPMQFLVGSTDRAVRRRKLGPRLPQMVCEHAQLPVRPVEEPVVPEQQGHQSHAAEQQGGDKGGEYPVQVAELLLILRDELGTPAVGARGYFRELRIEGGEQAQEAADRTWASRARGEAAGHCRCCRRVRGSCPGTRDRPEEGPRSPRCRSGKCRRGWPTRPAAAGPHRHRCRCRGWPSRRWSAAASPARLPPDWRTR